MFTEEEVKAAKATREAIIKGDVAELKSIYMAGEICMWDEMQSRQAAVSGSLPLPGQNEIAKAADKFLVENSTTPHIDHWSFRMGARWGINEVLTGGNDR